MDSINKQYPWLHASPEFFCSCDCFGEDCGEVKCPYCIENCDFESYVLHAKKRTALAALSSRKTTSSTISARSKFLLWRGSSVTL